MARGRLDNVTVNVPTRPREKSDNPTTLTPPEQLIPIQVPSQGFGVGAENFQVPARSQAVPPPVAV